MKQKRAFTLIELLVVIAIIAILMGIMMPALQKVKQQAQEMNCRSNLRNYGVMHNLYLDDFDGRYPYPWTSLVKNERPTGLSDRSCRWHAQNFPPDGPIWKYIPDKKVNLCPTFKTLAKTMGNQHSGHSTTSPAMQPQYSYSMNAMLGATERHGGIIKFSEITRVKSEVFFFAEENMWTRPGCVQVLNDNALCADNTDFFGTFHGAKKGNWNGGTINAVFVDSHVAPVKSALQVSATNTAQYVDAEFGTWEKYGWPKKTKPSGM